MKSTEHHFVGGSCTLCGLSYFVRGAGECKPHKAEEYKTEELLPVYDDSVWAAVRERIL